MKKLILVGGGGHCRSCIDVIEQTNAYEIIGIVDQSLTVKDTVCGYPILGDDSQLERLASVAECALITIGQLENPAIRMTLFDRLLKLGYALPTIISPLAYVARDVTIGAGSIIMNGAMLNTNASVGKNCIINTRALIEHDAKILDDCHVSTAATVNGRAIVGEGSFIASNAVIIHNVNVPRHSFIKANHVFKG